MQRRTRELRREARQRLLEGDAAAAQERLLALPELAAARAVALYAALPGEVPLERVEAELRAGGRLTLFPRVIDGDLVFHAAQLADLAPGFRAVAEPPATSPSTPLDAIDVFVVPGLRFDRAGRRLGRGLGLYDRALGGASPAAARIGLCYADGIVEALPEAEWDVRMHVIVSDRAVLRPATALRPGTALRPRGGIS